MALSDFLKGDGGKGLAVGFAGAVLAPMILPVLSGAAKPLARAAIKGGILLYAKSRETFAEMEETFDDLVAEVKAELEQEQELAKEHGEATSNPHPPAQTQPEE
jgi:hypothetical protein